MLRRYLCQGLAAVLALMSVIVVWSELTFFNAEPVLSLFAIFVNLAKANYDYVSIEVNCYLVEEMLSSCCKKKTNKKTDLFSLIFHSCFL